MIQGNAKEQSIISLQQLQSFTTKTSTIFSTYIYNPLKKLQRIELVTLDTKQMPKIPLRRQGCNNCTSQSLSCQKCPQCQGKGKICCRGLACIYDYETYKHNKESKHYAACQCTKGKQPSTSRFSIDWRLLSLIQKLPTTHSKTQNFYLYFSGTTLWLTMQTVGTYDISSIIIHEDNFGYFALHQRQTKNNLSPMLALSNSRNFSSLLQLNIRKYLSTKDAWEVSNLQEECQEIADSFFSNKKLEGIKANLQQNQASQNGYSNMPSLRFQGKYSQILVTKGKSQRTYPDCSDSENQEIIFSYCPKSQLIFIRNAKFYENDEQYSNLRGVRVRWREENAPIGSQAIWFKDRKGDIFAISKGTLSIFKYNIQSKSYEQFLLQTNPLFATVDSSACLLYIPQKDTVYYFNHKQLKKSFYFTLYRPKDAEDPSNKSKKDTLSKHSCVSVTLQRDFLADKQKSLPRQASPCKVTYVMQDYKFKSGKDQRKQLVPVIYLISQKKNYLPIGVAMYRIVHHDDQLIINELPSMGIPSSSNDQAKSINFNIGIYFTLKLQKSVKFCLFSLVEGKSTLLSAYIKQEEGKENLNWSQEYIYMNGCFEVKTENARREQLKIDERREEGYSQDILKIVNHIPCSTQSFDARDFKGLAYEPILITDLAGIVGNNQLRMIGENIKNGSVVEVALSYVQGVPQWRIFDLT